MDAGIRLKSRDGLGESRMRRRQGHCRLDGFDDGKLGVINRRVSENCHEDAIWWYLIKFMLSSAVILVKGSGPMGLVDGTRWAIIRAVGRQKTRPKRPNITGTREKQDRNAKSLERHGCVL